MKRESRGNAPEKNKVGINKFVFCFDIYTYVVGTTILGCMGNNTLIACATMLRVPH